MKTKPIGVFDSGFGGLTVLSELVAQFPNEDFIYLGDTLRVPYGNKSATEILQYSLQISQWLVRQDVKAIVVACNTSSCIALPTLRSELNAQFFGMIDSGIETVIKYQDLLGEDIKRLGIIGTRNTISSRVHENAMRAAGFIGEIVPVACPLFVPILEEGVMDRYIWNSVINYYLSTLRDRDTTALLLACTHYPILTENLQEYFEGKIQLLDPNFMLAAELKEFLTTNDLLNNVKGSGKIELCITGSVDSFKAFYNRFFDFNAEKVRVIDLADLSSYETN
ncbi:MAG: glutamate racemase [bacterium]|nr:glutamate racemase [bacterium]